MALKLWNSWTISPSKVFRYTVLSPDSFLGSPMLHIDVSMKRSGSLGTFMYIMVLCCTQCRLSTVVHEWEVCPNCCILDPCCFSPHACAIFNLGSQQVQCHMQIVITMPLSAPDHDSLGYEAKCDYPKQDTIRQSSIIKQSHPLTWLKSPIMNYCGLNISFRQMIQLRPCFMLPTMVMNKSWMFF